MVCLEAGKDAAALVVSLKLDDVAAGGLDLHLDLVAA
jgi:hypothetical protein